jgi:hypothetical protein
MAFAQLTFRESLRDIEACLRSFKNKLYHIGIRGKISRSTLADANNKRNWRIYADFAQSLIHQARELYSNEKFGVELDNTVYALDSTTISLCLSLFPWAAYCKTQAGVRVHTLLDLQGSIPSFVEITTAMIPDMNILDSLILEPGSFYIMDRGYVDLKRLYLFNQAKSFFVIRAKKKILFKRVYSNKVNKESNIRLDQIIKFTGDISSKKYPEKIRRIKFYDKEREKQLVFLTNNLLLPAETIAQLYKKRWNIELFFKWIKQHLRIKKFYGTTENAVKTQIWIAISVYVLIAIIKKRLKIKRNLYTFLQILSVSIFEKTNLFRLVDEKEDIINNNNNSNQLELFEL